jgi:hypothetical protein
MEDRQTMKTIIASLGLITLLALAGCTSYVTVRPYTPAGGESLNVQTGLVYYLPKTLIDAKVTYSVYEERTWRADFKGDAIKTKQEDLIGTPVRVIDLDTPPEILLVTVPDLKLGFTLDPSDMVRFGVGIKDGKFEVKDDGMLKSAGVGFHDKSLEAAQGFLKTGIAVAKLVAVAKIANTVKERKLLKQVVVRKTLDLPDFTVKANNDYVYSFDTEARRYLGQDAPSGVSVPKAELILTLPDTYQKSASATSKDVVTALDPKNKDCVHGIVSRIPAKVHVRFMVGDLAVADSYQLLAQVGGFSFAPISSRRFTEYTTGVTISLTSGGITQFTINATSAAAALATFSQSTSETATTTVKDFNVEIMKAETARLNAEADLIKARKSLKEAKKP